MFAFSLPYLAAVVATKRAHFLYAAILLLLTSYFMAWHALGVPAGAFPPLSVPPLFILWAVGYVLRRRLPQELDVFPRTVFRAVNVAVCAFTVWALVQAPNLIAQGGVMSYAAGLTFLCYASLYFANCVYGRSIGYLYSFSFFLTIGAIACGAAGGPIELIWAPALAAASVVLFLGIRLHRQKTYGWSRHLYFCAAAVVLLSLAFSAWRLAWFLLELPLASLLMWASYLWLARAVGDVRHATSAERTAARWLFFSAVGLSTIIVPLVLVSPANVNIDSSALLFGLILSWIAVRRREDTLRGVNIYALDAVLLLSAGLLGLGAQLPGPYASVWSLLSPLFVMAALGVLYGIVRKSGHEVVSRSLALSGIFPAFFAWYVPLSQGEPLLALACAAVPVGVSLALAWRLKEGLFLRALGPATAGLLVSGALAWAGPGAASWAICAGAAAAAGMCMVWADAKGRDGLRTTASLSWLIFSAAAVIIASATDPRQALYSVTAAGSFAVLIAGWQRKQGRHDLFNRLTVALSALAAVAAVALGPVSGLSLAGAGVCVLCLSAAYGIAWGLGKGTGYARGALALLALGLLLVVFGVFRAPDARLAAGAIAVAALFALGAAARPRFGEIASSAAFLGHVSSAVLAGAALVQAWPLGSSWLPLAAAPYVVLYAFMPRLRANAGFRFGAAGWLSLLTLFALSAVADVPYRENLLPMAILALTWVALGYALHRTKDEPWSRPLYICGAVLAACCCAVSLSGPAVGGSWSIYLANGLVFALLFLILRQDILAYLLTLSLSLMAYDWVKASTSPFTQDVLFYLVIGAGVLGLFFLLPQLKATVNRIGALPMATIYTWRGAALASVPALGIGVFLLSAYSVKITEHPRFCTSCHNMKEYYESWQHSSHKDVSCVKCHYDPGVAAEVKGKVAGLVQLVKYVSHTQGVKPHALISDESCMRAGCHPQMDRNNDLLVLNGKIQFRHEEHLGGQPRGHVLHCDNCHKMVQEGVHIGVTETPCLTCHFYGRGNAPVAVGDCKTCHVVPEGDVSFAGEPFNHRKFLADKKDVQCIQCHSNVTEGQGRVAPERCKSCHLKAFSDIGDHAQLHLIHTSQQHLECLQCHDEIKHGMHPMVEQLLTSENCATCHGGDRHTVQERIYSGTAVPEVEPIPDVMYKAGVACDGCHTDVHFIKAGEMVLSTRVAGGKQCAQCHADESFTAMVAVWQKDVRDRLAEIQPTADELEGLCKTADAANGQVARAKDLLAAAQSKLAVVRLDGSYGAHNIAYVSAILDGAESDLKKGSSAIAELKNQDQKGPEQ